MATQKGKTALITGASGGIGYELALQCAKHGQNLILVARSTDKLKDIKKDLSAKYGVSVESITADLSVAGEPEKVYHSCRDKGLTVDYLINNAGFGDYRPVVEADAKVYANMINLNILALTELTTLFVKDMVARKSGAILNVASTAAYQPVPRLAVYAASKSYVVSFTEALHSELSGTSVTATVFSPGVTETGFVDRAQMNDSSFAKGTQADPADVAKAGYNAMVKGKLYVVPGLLNKLLVFSGRITPSRRLVLAISNLVSK